MKRLLWLDTHDCLYVMDQNGNYQKEMNQAAEKGGKVEFFFEIPDGPFLVEGITVGLIFDEFVLDVVVKKGMIRYYPKGDICWFGVEIEFFELIEIEELYEYFKQSWTANPGLVEPKCDSPFQ